MSRFIQVGPLYAIDKMGLESLLLSFSFKKPLSDDSIVEVFENAGASFLAAKSNISDSKEFRNWYFEIRTENGLTEINLLLPPTTEHATTGTVRFSILSPAKVIDQTLEFLKRLKTKRALKVFDTQLNSKELSLDIDDFKTNKENERKRMIVLRNKTGLVIEGGSTTTSYIHENNLVDEIWGLK